MLPRQESLAAAATYYFTGQFYCNAQISFTSKIAAIFA
jgi:hypothetical protein